ncbi:MAG: hypothetical protein Q8R18_01000, partial [bacterium]|nr:hypothetical protein [bacterium]
MKRGKKVGLVVCISLFLLLLSSLVVAPTKDKEGSEGTGSAEKENAFPSTPVTSYSGYTAENPEIEDDTDFLIITPTEEGAEPSYTQLEGDFTGTVKTDYGETSGTFSNMVVGNGGIYEATITGIAAGT